MTYTWDKFEVGLSRSLSMKKTILMKKVSYSIFCELQGFFMAPTVITNVPINSVAMKEEIFGPVTCIQKFVTEDEAVEAANNNNYGLCSAVFTSNLNTAHRTAKNLKVISHMLSPHESLNSRVLELCHKRVR